jgi:FkbM family methyltransferase
MRKYFPEAAIYSFEPIATTFEELQHNTRRYPKIRCCSYALGSQPTRAIAHVRSESGIATLVHQTNEWREDVAFENVVVRTIDDVCDEFKISKFKSSKWTCRDMN